MTFFNLGRSVQLHFTIGQEIILDNFPDAKVTIGECGALCSFYAEEGGLMVGFEKE